MYVPRTPGPSSMVWSQATAITLRRPAEGWARSPRSPRAGAFEPADQRAPPLLRLAHLVEREQMQALDAGGRAGQRAADTGEQPVGAGAVGHAQPDQPAGMPGPEPGRLRDARLGRHVHQAGPWPPPREPAQQPAE